LHAGECFVGELEHLPAPGLVGFQEHDAIDLHCHQQPSAAVVLDATLIRILFVVLAALGGSGLVLYLAMWIIVPNEPSAAACQPGMVHPIV